MTPDEEGTYAVICTELCGIGHSTMRAPVVVESQAEFDAWVAEQPDEAAGAEDAGGEPARTRREPASASRDNGLAGGGYLATIAAGGSARLRPFLLGGASASGS